MIFWWCWHSLIQATPSICSATHSSTESPPHLSLYSFWYHNMLIRKGSHKIIHHYIDYLTASTRSIYTFVVDDNHPPRLFTFVSKKLKNMEHMIIRGLQDFLLEYKAFLTCLQWISDRKQLLGLPEHINNAQELKRQRELLFHTRTHRSKIFSILETNRNNHKKLLDLVHQKKIQTPRPHNWWSVHVAAITLAESELS